MATAPVCTSSRTAVLNWRATSRCGCGCASLPSPSLLCSAASARSSSAAEITSSSTSSKFTHCSAVKRGFCDTLVSPCQCIKKLNSVLAARPATSGSSSQHRWSNSTSCTTMPTMPMKPVRSHNPSAWGPRRTRCTLPMPSKSFLRSSCLPVSSLTTFISTCIDHGALSAQPHPQPPTHT